MSKTEDKVRFMDTSIRSLELESFVFSEKEKEEFREAARTGDFSKIHERTEAIIKKYEKHGK